MLSIFNSDSIFSILYQNPETGHTLSFSCSVYSFLLPDAEWTALSFS